MTATISPHEAILALNALPGLGPISRQRLLEAFAGDPVRLLSAKRTELQDVQGIGPKMAAVLTDWRSHFDLAREQERLARGGVVFVEKSNEAYPPLLREIYDPPLGLYLKGPCRPQLKTVAIIGTRHCSVYGQGVAKRLASELARLGFCIVSGMARGIDTAAHEGALQAGGETVAVLGCGIDIIYPPENLDLYRRIAESGAVVSELPFGTQATRNTFPLRNRVISGISQAVIVVESAASGGSMITARFAAEHGRHLLAVPGRIDQASSAGCHQLIRDGAVLMTSVEDVLEELAYMGRQADLAFTEGEPVAPGEDWDAGLNTDERAVLATLIEGDVLMPDKIATASRLPVATVAATLLMLELKKRVIKQADGRFAAQSR